MRIFLALLLLLTTAAQADNTDWSKPGLADSYTTWPQSVKDLARAAAKMDYEGDSNLPTGVIRYNESTNQLEKYNGTTWDALTITNLKANSVGTSQLQDLSISAAKIGEGNVTNSKIQDNAVTSGKIQDGAVTTDELGNLAVTTAKIAEGNVTGAKIQDGAVSTGKIADDAVTSAKLDLTWGTYADSLFNCGATEISTSIGSGYYVELGSVVLFSVVYVSTVTTSGTCMGGNLPTATHGDTPVALSFMCRCLSTDAKPCAGYIVGEGSDDFVVTVTDQGDVFASTGGGGSTISCSGFYERS